MDNSEFDRLDTILDAFDRQWQAGIPVSIESILARESDVPRPKLLKELLLIEIECRHKQGQSLSESEYAARFPEYRSIVHRVFQHANPKATDDRDEGGASGEADVETLPPNLPSSILPKGAAAAGMHVGPYELVEQLGSGASGQVWLGKRDGALATTHVAVKIPNSSASTIRIVRNEAQSWVRASGHPNVVPIIEADVYGENVAIVSEYVAGGTLAKELQRVERMPYSQAVELMIGVLSGLEFLHAKEIIHRDLKPANIMLQHGIPRLTDFGLARSAELRIGGIGGTPAYMPPEAFEGESSVRSDLWSVGVILFQILFGRVPFRTTCVDDLIADITSPSTVPIPTELPKPLGGVLAQALAKPVADRFASAADMRAALSACRRRLPREHRTDADIELPYHLTISVTGSMRANPDQVLERLRPLLAPYQAPLTTWYTGSNGSVDEQAAKLLVDSEQQVFLVGYTRNDISDEARHLIENLDFPFIDAEVENIPPEPNAPSRRDIFFATKSDLVILIWDGESKGTRQLHDWLRRHHRDHLIAYL